MGWVEVGGMEAGRKKLVENGHIDGNEKLEGIFGWWQMKGN
jgi:hypothetical protein